MEKLTKAHFEHEIYLLNEEFYTTQMTKDEYLGKLFPLQRAMLRAPEAPLIRGRSIDTVVIDDWKRT